ncbi:MAG: EF-hand domain-containing protein [Oceanicaulis sp.]
MKPTLLVTAPLLSLTLSAGAAAQDAPRTERAAPDRAYAQTERAEGRRGAYALIRLGAADANGDKRVTRAELEALRAAEFGYRDRDEDGAISLADLSPTRQRLADMAGDDEGRLGRGQTARLDADRDGRVTRAEFMDAPTPLFDRLDANGDGVVTGEEIDAALQARRDRRGERREQRRERMDRAVWWRD